MSKSSKYSEQDAALAILKKFHNQSDPINLNDFRDLVFRCLHDAYVNKDRDSIIRDEDITTMYHLWNIINDVDDFLNPRHRDGDDL